MSTGANEYSESPFLPKKGQVNAEMIANGTVVASDIQDGTITLGTVGTGTVAGKLSAKYKVAVVGTAVTAVAHGLGSTPVGYLTTREKGPSGKIYDAAAVSAWTSTNAYFKSTKAATSATFLFF